MPRPVAADDVVVVCGFPMAGLNEAGRIDAQLLGGLAVKFGLPTIRSTAIFVLVAPAGCEETPARARFGGGGRQHVANIVSRRIAS
jgi:hypothetical protein